VGVCISCTIIFMKFLLSFFAVILATLSILLSISNPNNASLFLFLVIFLLIYFLFFDICLVIFWLATEHKDYRKFVFVSVVISFGPTSFIALATLSSVNFMDVLLAFGIPISIVWYGLRSRYLR
jgi:hypothetical protein